MPRLRIPFVRFGRDDSPTEPWELLFLPVMLPLFFVGFALLAGLSLAWIPFAAVAVWHRERAFARRMKEQGRHVVWGELESRLELGDGTLIVEQAQNDCVRFWWTSDDVLQEAPEGPPPEEKLDYLRLRPAHPFVRWCFDRYLSPAGGRALLTDPPDDLFIELVESSWIRTRGLRSRFPAMRVVATVKLD